MEQLETIVLLKEQFEADVRKYGNNPTDKLESAIKISMAEANKLFDDVLARRDRADATRSALALMQRYRFLFCMPVNIEKNIKRGNYDLVINDYARVKNLFGNTDVEVFKRVLKEIEDKIDLVRDILRKKLDETPFALERQKKIIRNLVNLEANGDPAWDAIGKYFYQSYFRKNIMRMSPVRRLRKIGLKMYGTYIANQKFDSIRISVLSDATKIFEKSKSKNLENIYFARY